MYVFFKIIVWLKGIRELLEFSETELSFQLVKHPCRFDSDDTFLWQFFELF